MRLELNVQPFKIVNSQIPRLPGIHFIKSESTNHSSGSTRSHTKHQPNICKTNGDECPLTACMQTYIEACMHACTHVRTSVLYNIVNALAMKHCKCIFSRVSIQFRHSYMSSLSVNHWTMFLPIGNVLKARITVSVFKSLLLLSCSNDRCTPCWSCLTWRVPE